MYAKHYENPTMLSRVTAKNVGDVFFETHCIVSYAEVTYRSRNLARNSDINDDIAQDLVDSL